MLKMCAGGHSFDAWLVGGGASGTGSHPQTVRYIKPNVKIARPAAKAKRTVVTSSFDLKDPTMFIETTS
jgi:hypothetical protein